MYYEEKFENGKWWYRTTPDGEWRKAQDVIHGQHKELEAARAEIANLKHDIERHVTICAEQSNEIERLTHPRIGEQWPAQGGVYAGIARGTEGRPDYHLILFSLSAKQDATWQQAKEWAADLRGGHGLDDYTLPTRREQALLYANVPEQFENAWYWSSEQLAAFVDYAWMQVFGNGDQGGGHKSYQYRARAVRRLDI